MHQYFLFVLIPIHLTLFKYCKTELDSFILDGDYADIEMFPHSTYLSIPCEGNFMCGSSVLGQNVLLTAAHCVCNCNLRKNRLEALAGHALIKKVNV